MSVLTLVVLLLQPSCVTGVSQGALMAGGQRGVPASYKQSCALNPMCVAPSASGELIIPATVQKVVVAAEVVQGLLTLKDYLDEAEVARVEDVLVRCAREADHQINKKEYPEEGYPSDAECDRVVGKSAKGVDITRAMELGTMKHAVAFACVERELGSEFSDHVTREPRYGKKPPADKYALTDEETDSLVPDIVLHLVRDANKIQYLYDFLFPCKSKSKADPLGFRRQTLIRKLDKYRELPGENQRALVTPQLGISR